MDYKEKYEIGLEGIQEILGSGEDSIKMSRLKLRLQGIFPELKESEDESIIRDIRVVLESSATRIFKENGQMPVWYDRAVAWLEKQGEQEPTYYHHEVDLSGCSEEYRKAYYDGWNNCNMQHSQCRSELDDVVKCLINGMKFYYEDNEEATWGTDKWSMPVKHIIEVLEKQGKSALEAAQEEKVDNQNCVKPTDKVEPKTTAWKPSDEQLKALKEACDEHWEPDGLDPLYTLYQDLKKLMEE